MLQVKYFPWSNYFYLNVGSIYNDIDKEDIEFRDQLRTIGDNQYTTDLSISITRPAAIKPAFGIGLSWPITHSVFFNTDFTMNWLGDIQNPDIRIHSTVHLDDRDRSQLRDNISQNYKNNFHNRYHLFNIGVQIYF